MVAFLPFLCLPVGGRAWKMGASGTRKKVSICNDPVVSPERANALRLIARLAANEEGMTELDISNADLVDADAIALASALERNTHCEAIDASANPRIGNEGARALLAALRSRNTTLRRLDLDDDPATAIDPMLRA